jgi:hypothetical protein
MVQVQQLIAALKKIDDEELAVTVGGDGHLYLGSRFHPHVHEWRILMDTDPPTVEKL